MKKRLTLAVLLGLCFSVVALAQLKQGTLGVTASILESPNIGLVYASNEQTRLSAAFGFSLRNDSTGNTSTYRFTASVWRYILTTENISNFYGGSLGFDAQSYPVGTSSSFGVAALYGAEYWFSSKFALSGTFQLHFSTGKEYGSKVSRVFTSVETGLTWYF